MDGVGAPVGDVIGHAVPGEQGMAFLVLEDHQGFLAGGAAAALTWLKSSKSAPLKKRSRA